MNSKNVDTNNCKKESKANWLQLNLRTRRLILISVMGILVIFLAVWFRGLFQSTISDSEVSERKENTISNSDVVGDLGGVPVKIPYYFANFVEYEGDPGWGKRNGSEPTRNHQSKLVSFGFEVRFPDMVGLSSRQMVEDRQGFNIFNTPWIDVGITTGKNYGDGAFLENWFKSNTQGRKFLFERRLEKEFDLEVYSPLGVDPATRQPFNTHSDDKDVFAFRNSEGNIVALIICSNVSHAAAPCSLDYRLDQSVKAWVNIRFRRTLLSEWKQIQESVTKLILSFRTLDIQGKSLQKK